MISKWSSSFWVDLGERVGATFVGALIAVFSAAQTGTIIGSPEQWWLLVGLPTLLSLLKGLSANFANPVSGASLVPPPDGPDIRNDSGAANILYVLGVVLVLLAVLLLVTTLLKVFVVSWLALIVLFIVGVALLVWQGNGTTRV